MRAKCLQEVGETSAAKEDLDEALEHKPGCAGLHMQRYELLCACRQYTEAFFELQHVQRLSPDWPGLFLKLQKAASLSQFSHTSRAGVNDDGVRLPLTALPIMTSCHIIHALLVVRGEAAVEGSSLSLSLSLSLRVSVTSPNPVADWMCLD